LKVSSPTVHAQDHKAPPFLAFHPYYYRASQGMQFLWLAVSSRAELSSEVLFLRKQLAFYQQHQVPPRKLTDAARFSLALWSRLFHWRAALMIVQPETLISWHRQGFKLFWRWKSRRGRPRIPENLRQLIVRMAQENPTWAKSASQPNWR
jgi:putative transposase